MAGLVKILEAQLTESDTTDSETGQQRERNHRYYVMGPLGNEVKGRSHYIDPRVFTGVESKKAIYHETFLGSRQVVRFNGSNKDESTAKTAYAQRILKANEYQKLFRDGWHDAFVAKRMTIWADWKRNHETVTLKFMGATSQQVNAQLKQMGTIIDVDREGLQSLPIPSVGQQQFLHRGTLKVTVDRSYIDLDLIQPEFVMRDPSADDAMTATWNTARVDITKLMLIDWGFDEDQVDKLKKDYRWGSEEEDTARKSSDQSQQSQQGARINTQEEVTIYKTRTWLMPDDLDDGSLADFEPEDGAAIYEIYWTADGVLKWNDGTPAIKVLEDMAVYEWTEFKIAHADSGICTADVEAHQQKSGSGLKRGVMDNMSITNNPRWEANTGALRDPRDLFDNAIGSVIETEDGVPVGQIKALEQPQLSPVVFGVMQMLDRDSENRTGMSDLARGMNMGAVTNQNADSMIERLTTAGARRVAMGARDFANTFLVPLLQCIVRLAMQNDKSQTTMEGGGKQIIIAPSQWTTDNEMEIEVALTPEEAQVMAQQLMVVDQRLALDPAMAPLYGLQQKHALWDTVYELMGIKDSTKFLGNPNSPEVQQALATMQQQMQAEKQKQDQFTMLTVAAKEDEHKRLWQELNNNMLDKMEDNNRADEQLYWDNYFRREELKLERQQGRQASI